MFTEDTSNICQDTARGREPTENARKEKGYAELSKFGWGFILNKRSRKPDIPTVYEVPASAYI